MSVHKSLEQLGVTLSELARVLKEQQVNVDDAPDHVIPERVYDGLQDVCGFIDEARLVVGRSVGASGLGSHADVIRRWVAVAHEFVLQAGEKLDALLSYDEIGELRDFGERHQDTAELWSVSVQRGLESCREAERSVHRALLDAWQEIAERWAAGSVAVQTTTIGHHVSHPAELVEEDVPVTMSRGRSDQ